MVSKSMRTSNKSYPRLYGIDLNGCLLWTFIFFSFLFFLLSAIWNRSGAHISYYFSILKTPPIILCRRIQYFSNKFALLWRNYLYLMSKVIVIWCIITGRRVRFLFRSQEPRTHVGLPFSRARKSNKIFINWDSFNIFHISRHRVHGLLSLLLTACTIVIFCWRIFKLIGCIYRYWKHLVINFGRIKRAFRIKKPSMNRRPL